MAAFDLISDIHLDFWVDIKSNEQKQQSNIDDLVDSLVPPDQPSSTLVIAGDLGHYNLQNEMMLKSFKRYYDHILFVFGNHDLYLVSNKALWRYNRKSMRRRDEMKCLAELIEGVICLDGVCITLDGVTYGGAGGWYDFSFGTQMLGMGRSHLYDLWKRSMNDAHLIYPRFSDSDLLDFFYQEYKKLESIFDQSQVIVTHVGPDWSRVHGCYAYDPVSSFYYFNGTSLLERARGKIWCFGHTHNHYSYYHSSGCYMVNNALGYPGENPRTKIQTIEV